MGFFSSLFTVCACVHIVSYGVYRLGYTILYDICITIDISRHLAGYCYARKSKGYVFVASHFDCQDIGSDRDFALKMI